MHLMDHLLHLSRPCENPLTNFCTDAHPVKCIKRFLKYTFPGWTFTQNWVKPENITVKHQKSLKNHSKIKKDYYYWNGWPGNANLYALSFYNLKSNSKSILILI